MIGRNVKSYCKDFTKIENYEKAIEDTTQIWSCHHRAEIVYTAKELVEKGMYYNVLPCDLIFLTPSEHQKMPHKGKKFSEEHKRKSSEAHKGNKNALGFRHSDECRKRMSESHKGKHWKLVDGKRVYY